MMAPDGTSRATTRSRKNSSASGLPAGPPVVAMTENYKNVRRSMVENARQGFFDGSCAPFGYGAVTTDIKRRAGFKRRPEPNANEAEVARTIFKLVIAGDAGEQELDAAVLNVVAEKILQPDRILAMLEQLREQIAKLQAPDRECEKLIQRQMALATEQINT